MHECTGLTLTLPAQCQNRAVSWPEGSCVILEAGTYSGDLNSLEQEVTRDLVMWIHLGAAACAVCAAGLAGPADGLPIFSGKAEEHGRFPLQNAQFSWKYAYQEEAH